MNPNNCSITGVCEPKQWGPSYKCKWCHRGLKGNQSEPSDRIRFKNTKDRDCSP